MAYYLDPGFTGGPGSLFFDIDVDWPVDQVMQGLPVPKQVIHSPFRVVTRQRRLPDFVFFQAAYCGVSAAALKLLYALAPRDIEAIPVAIVDKHNAPIPGEYYYLNVLLFCDSLIIDESNCKTLNNRVMQRDGSEINHQVKIIYHAKLKMKKTEINGAHIWHELYAEPNGRHKLFASNILIDATRELRLSGLSRAIPIPEV